MNLLTKLKKRVGAPIYYNLVLFKKFLRFSEDRFENIEIEISSVCNYSCKYCPVSTLRRKAGEMSTETYKKIIDELAEVDYDGVVSPNFFNEPLIDKRIVSLMNYTREKLPNCKIVIFTNGSLLTKELFHNLIIAGVNKFEITQHTEKELPNITELFNTITSEEMNMINYKNLTLDTAVLNNRGGLVEDRNNLPFYYCMTATDFMTINYKGDVVLCCNDYKGEYWFGNVNEENIFDIWRREHFKQVRKEIRQGNFILPICKVCSKKDIK